MSLRFSFDYRSTEVGYSVARMHWRKGICTEAARTVIETAFSPDEDLDRVHATADADYAGSQRVMEKMGMAKEGVLRLNRVKRGEALAEALY
jgi:[ribosomal protein S5]-alanine N-acetyltransferase